MIIDKPLSDSKRDKLGFGNIAQSLASAFLQNDLRQGFVVGVEGAWGSGKSSLVNLALDELCKKDVGPKVIKFAPWLVGSRNELLTQLFADLEPVVLDLLPEAERDDTKKILGQYAKLSSGLAVLADLAEVGGMPYASRIAKVLKKSGQKAAELSERSLGDLNQSLRGKLARLDHPIVVFIDDLDRLEPSEVAEVLRLVKAVADFPNVAYILAYDPEVIADSVQRALGISDGRAYLEKVVQASFKVPSAMNFDLRNWLKDEVSLLLGEVTIDVSAKKRLDGVYHQWCGEYLETARDVVRVVNSLKLNFSPVRDQVDPADMVFLQIIRTKNSELFNWIESYVSSLSAIGDWGFIQKGAHTRVGQELLGIIKNKKGEEQALFVYALSEHLPGFDLMSLHRSVGEFKVFAVNGVEELQPFIAEKRLASPNHYSYYFSFTGPAGSLDDGEVEQFLVACEQAPEKAIARFRQLIGKQRPQGGRFAELLLDRIVAARASVSPTQVGGLFRVLGEVIDELAPFAVSDRDFADFLRGERREVFGLIEKVGDEDVRNGILRELFDTAKSLAWLTGIIRAATFEHGLYGDQGKPEGTWLLSEAEFSMAKDIFVKRLLSASPSELLQVPHFSNLIYAWHQLGDAEGPVSWIKDQTETDHGLLEVLGNMTSRSRSSHEGVQYKLRRSVLDTFFAGMTVVEKRLKKIASDEMADEEMKREAERLLEMFYDLE